MLPYQVKEEGVKASAKTHRREDAQADPVGAPQRLLFYVTHILQREARERDGQPHGRDTCTESEENKEGGAQREEGRDRDRVKEGTRVKVCNTEGTLKGGRGQVSGREREREEESERETFRDRGCC